MTDANTNPDAGPNAIDLVEALAHLKRKADTLGIPYSARIGIDALREKVNAALNSDGSGDDEKPERALSKIEREALLRKELQERELKLVRCRITNLNPNKKELQGEILCVANKYLGDVKKFIAYGEATDEGYQIPMILYNELKSRKYTSLRSRTVKGQIVVDQRWVPEFAIEVLEQLNEKELKKLALKQAAAAGASTELDE